MPGIKTNHKLVVGIVGLGYVGLPLALEFAKAKVTVIGYDINSQRIADLNRFLDRSGEISRAALKKVHIDYTTDPQELKKANFIIAAIPTPVDKKNKPDLTLLIQASETIGRNLASGTTVVYESTVYPGVTLEICCPIIEKFSHLKCGREWFIGYSPERVNPGDKKHTIGKIIKIVSGMDEATLKKVAQVYKIICKNGVFLAPNIQTAEMAKVFENIQRDVNIALVNELALINHRLGLETRDVLEAAGTKWNFLKFHPGLVGGHCVGVDPFYLVEKAEAVGYKPQIITAGRKINDYMPRYLAEKVKQGLAKTNLDVKDKKILVMGLTFKENVKDTRNSKIATTIDVLKKWGAKVYGLDPNLTSSEISREFKIEAIEKLSGQYDAIIIGAPHEAFKGLAQQIMTLRPTVVFDVSGVLREKIGKNKKINYFCL